MGIENCEACVFNPEFDNKTHCSLCSHNYDSQFEADPNTEPPTNPFYCKAKYNAINKDSGVRFRVCPCPSIHPEAYMLFPETGYYSREGQLVYRDKQQINEEFEWIDIDEK